MPKTCSYELCKNDQFRLGIRFFKFPLADKDPERRRLWAVRCNRRNVDGHTWEPNPKTKYVYVCSDHFITGLCIVYLIYRWAYILVPDCAHWLVKSGNIMRGI